MSTNTVQMGCSCNTTGGPMTCPLHNPFRAVPPPPEMPGLTGEPISWQHGWDAGYRAALATLTVPVGQAEEFIRQTERRRMAGLLEENTNLFATFARDPEHLVMLICFMLRLGTGGDDYTTAGGEGVTDDGAV